MEHGGKTEHRVFREKCAMCGSVFMSAWFPSLASVAWHNTFKQSQDNHILDITQKHNFPIFEHFDE